MDDLRPKTKLMQPATKLLDGLTDSRTLREQLKGAHRSGCIWLRLINSERGLSLVRDLRQLCPPPRKSVLRSWVAHEFLPSLDEQRPYHVRNEIDLHCPRIAARLTAHFIRDFNTIAHIKSRAQK
ncbi:hypothetical protein ACQR16_00525 [Bradyrhizobium oligotrophicum]|uniref:hypothetical protein n=1 Tax=Bradyrhizobium oligotrophicum TaxID=44255 RepID=UPI003EBA7EA2